MTPESPDKPNAVSVITQPPVQPAPRVPLNELLATIRDTDLVNAYGREIIESQLAVNRFDQDWRLARVFAESGLFADAQQLNQAMTKIQLGRSWNMDAADAMQHIYFVNGKPAVQNEYLGAKMRDAGLDWDVEWHTKDGICEGCTLWPKRLTADGLKPIQEVIGRNSDGSLKYGPASVSFTKADADRVKVKEDGKWIPLSEKSTYKSFPGDMYFWRAIARLRRRYATNILSGVFTRDEAEEVTPAVEAPPREKQSLDPAELTPAKAARRRGGVTEIPGTEAPKAESEAKTAAEPAPEPPKQETTVPPLTEPSGPPPPDAPAFPWDSQQSMNTKFRAQRDRIGADTFVRILNSVPGFMFGPDSWQDPVALKIYREMESATGEPAAPAAEQKPKKLF